MPPKLVGTTERVFGGVAQHEPGRRIKRPVKPLSGTERDTSTPLGDTNPAGARTPPDRVKQHRNSRRVPAEFYLPTFNLGSGLARVHLDVGVVVAFDVLRIANQIVSRRVTFPDFLVEELEDPVHGDKTVVGVTTGSDSEVVRFLRQIKHGVFRVPRGVPQILLGSGGFAGGVSDVLLGFEDTQLGLGDLQRRPTGRFITLGEFLLGVRNLEVRDTLPLRLRFERVPQILFGVSQPTGSTGSGISEDCGDESAGVDLRHNAKCQT